MPDNEQELGRRPGGRTARVRTAVLDAAADALVDHGLAGVDLADVARRAGVGKTTVYRRWGSVPKLVADMLCQMAETSEDRADTGSLDGDLQANADLVRRTLADTRQGPLLVAVIAAAAADPATAVALERFYRTRIAAWAPCVGDAIERGELPVDTDADAVIAAVSAPLYYQLLTGGRPPSPADAHRAAHAAGIAARAGAYTGDCAGER